jgi:hypothetical protein
MPAGFVGSDRQPLLFLRPQKPSRSRRKPVDRHLQWRKAGQYRQNPVKTGFLSSLRPQETIL